MRTDQFPRPSGLRIPSSSNPNHRAVSSDETTIPTLTHTQPKTRTPLPRPRLPRRLPILPTPSPQGLHGQRRPARRGQDKRGHQEGGLRPKRYVTFRGNSLKRGRENIATDAVLLSRDRSAVSLVLSHLRGPTYLSIYLHECPSRPHRTRAARRAGSLSLRLLPSVEKYNTQYVPIHKSPIISPAASATRAIPERAPRSRDRPHISREAHCDTRRLPACPPCPRHADPIRISARSLEAWPHHNRPAHTHKTHPVAMQHTHARMQASARLQDL